MKTIDIKFYELCNEVDYWKAEAKRYKELYEEELRQRSIESSERLLEAQKGVADALIFALHVKDTPDGSLVLDKKGRKAMAERFKSNEIPKDIKK